MHITGTTRAVAIFGYPVGHTLSPLIHNAAFQALGLDFIYCAFPVKPSHLKVATQAILALDMAGVNVTIPHKERIIDYLDRVSPEAEAAGAVNTVVNHKGRLLGDNTDGKGFIESLREQGLSLKGKKVLLLGAGGAALSVSFALLKEKIDTLILINRTLSRAHAMLKKLEGVSGAANLDVVAFERRNSAPLREDIDLLVNTTSVGMGEGDPSPINLEQFPPSLYVYDVVYNRETELLKQAKRKGMGHQGGLDMLIFQGVLSFELWTGKRAPVDTMREAARQHFGNET